MGQEILEWREIGSKPIRAEAPAGDPVRSDTLFEEIRGEIQKLESPSHDSKLNPVQWKKVVDLSRTILKEKSKDLLVGTYLCRGLLEEGRYPGLLGGLSCLEGMVQEFWPTLYPELNRMRARVNALKWLSENVGAIVEQKALQASERELAQECIQQVEAIEKRLDAVMGEESPGLSPLKEALRHQVARLEPEKPAEKTTPAKDPGRKSPITSQAETLSGDIDSVDGAVLMTQRAVSSLRRAAAVVREHDLSDPWPYRIVRTLTWMKVDETPPDTDGKTQLPPPAPYLSKQYQAVIDKGAWAELVHLVESQIQNTPFWLDLHRLTALALMNLGPTYAKAKEAVTIEFLHLIRRLPALLDLNFMNGIPFADEETRNWVERERRSREKEAGGTRQLKEAAHNGASTEHLTDLREKVHTLLRAGQMKEAISVSQQETKTMSSGRDRFLIRLELARVCIEAGHLKAAISQLELLDQQIGRFSLEEWEPDLSLQVLETLWRSLNRVAREAKEASPEVHSLAESVYRRICRLDVLAALEMDSKRTTRLAG